MANNVPFRRPSAPLRASVAHRRRRVAEGEGEKGAASRYYDGMCGCVKLGRLCDQLRGGGLDARSGRCVSIPSFAARGKRGKGLKGGGVPPWAGG